MIFTWEKERNCCKCRTQMRPSHWQHGSEWSKERGAWSVVVAVARVGMENLKFNRWQLIWPKCSDEAPPHIVSSRQQLCRVPAVQLELGQSTYKMPLACPPVSMSVCGCVCVVHERCTFDIWQLSLSLSVVKEN